jgi:hypothetical protein
MDLPHESHHRRPTSRMRVASAVRQVHYFQRRRWTARAVCASRRAAALFYRRAAGAGAWKCAGNEAAPNRNPAAAARCLRDTRVHNTTRSSSRAASQLLPLPSPLEQLERMTRQSMFLVLSAAAACPIFGRCPVRALGLQPHALLSMAPSQRLLQQLESLQLQCRRSQRLQLVRCGCPLSTVAFRLACANDGDSFSVQRAAAALVMRRCLSGFAWRHWEVEVRDIAS